MAKCFEQSHEAYSRGDGAGAKQLSNQGKEHQHKMESLNKQASDWIFVSECCSSSSCLCFIKLSIIAENNEVS